MRKDGLAKVTIKGFIESKTYRESQRAIYIWNERQINGRRFAKLRKPAKRDNG